MFVEVQSKHSKGCPRKINYKRISFLLFLTISETARYFKPNRPKLGENGLIIEDEVEPIRFFMPHTYIMIIIIKDDLVTSKVIEEYSLLCFKELK